MDWRRRGAGIAWVLGAAAAAMPMAPMALSWLVAALPLRGPVEAARATTDTSLGVLLSWVDESARFC